MLHIMCTVLLSASCRLKSAAVEDGAELVVGTFEVEVEQEITQESFRSGRCFLGDSADDAAPATSHLTAAFRARRSALTHTPKNTHLHPPLAPVVSTEASGRTTAAGLGLRKPSASTGLAGQDSEAVVLNRGRPDGTQVILDQFLTRSARRHASTDRSPRESGVRVPLAVATRVLAGG